MAAAKCSSPGDSLLDTLPDPAVEVCDSTTQHPHCSQSQHSRILGFNAAQAIFACLDTLDLERCLLVSKTWRRIAAAHFQGPAQFHVRAQGNQGSLTRLRKQMNVFNGLSKVWNTAWHVGPNAGICNSNTVSNVHGHAQVVLNLPTHLSKKPYGRAGVCGA